MIKLSSILEQIILIFQISDLGILVEWKEDYLKIREGKKKC